MNKIVLISFFFCAIIFISSCIKAEEETIDPIIGTWLMETEIELLRNSNCRFFKELINSRNIARFIKLF